MMKISIRKAMTYIVATAMAACVAACSDDDNGSMSVEEQHKAIEQVTATYLNDVVYPTYSALAAETETLYGKIAALKTKLKSGGTVAQGEIDEICKSYKTARKYWEESEAFLYGAASDFEIDPHIDTWPLDVATLAVDLNNNSKIAALDAEDGINYARRQLTKENLGFHGIEFIFFRNGKPRSKEVFNNDAVEDYSYKGVNYFSGMTVTGREEVIFATAVAGDLRDKCFQLEVAWMGDKAPASHRSRVAACALQFDDFGTTVKKNGMSYGDDMLAAGTATSTQASWKKVLETILVSGCSNICAEVADQKMGQAYRAANNMATPDGQEEPDDPNYIESPYSYNSFTDFRDNIVSIKNCLYGNRDGSTWSSHSVMAYLAALDASRASQLDSRLKAAMKALDDCLNSGTPFVQAPGASYVKTAMEAVSSLDDYINNTSNWLLVN